jgi:Zn-finger nucleic acid-binding protein
MKCPRCRTELGPDTVSGLAIHACAECGGVMMDLETFDRAATTPDLREDVIARARALHGAARIAIDLRKVVYLSCPECSGAMARKNFGRVSGALVDVCVEHGTWFDQGELAKCLEFVRDGGMERAAEFERAEAEHEREQRKVIAEIERKTPKFRGGWF